MNKWTFIICLLLLGPAVQAQAQGKDQYQRRKFIQGGDTLPYRVLLPLNYDPAKSYPLVIFLHGRGESGSDNNAQLAYGGKVFLRDSVRSAYPAIVVFPQCPANSYWSNVQTIADSNGSRVFYFIAGGDPSLSMRLLMGLCDNLPRQYRIDPKRVYVMGMSMGGMGVYELVRRRPGVFSAAVAMCGGADTSTATALTGTRWWLFHGEKDDVVPTHFSKDIAAALRRNGADVRLTLYPQANHNCWDPAFAEKDLFHWLFSTATIAK